MIGGRRRKRGGEGELELSPWVASAQGWTVKFGDASGRGVEEELGILRASTRHSHASHALGL